jgi:hypothetical protein
LKQFGSEAISPARHPYQGIFDAFFIQKFLLQHERFVIKIQKRIFLADHILRGE